MRLFHSRKSDAADQPRLAEPIIETEQSPGPVVLAALAACGSRARRALKAARPKLNADARARLRAATAPLRPQRRARFEDVAGPSRLFEHLDEAASSVQRTLPPMRAQIGPKSGDEADQLYGADPMLWSRARPIEPTKPAPAPKRRRAGWIGSFFF